MPYNNTNMPAKSENYSDNFSVLLHDHVPMVAQQQTQRSCAMAVFRYLEPNMWYFAMHDDAHVDSRVVSNQLNQLELCHDESAKAIFTFNYGAARKKSKKYNSMTPTGPTNT